MFWSWKPMMQLKNSGLPALKSGRSSVVELRFVLTVYKPRVLVFSICVASTWTVDTVHLVTCFFLAFECGRKSVVSALHYLSQPLWLSRAAKPMLSLRRRMESISREGREVGVLNVTRHPMSSKWSQSSVSRRAVQPVYNIPWNNIWAHSNPLTNSWLWAFE